MKDLIAKLHSDSANQILATFTTLEMQLRGFAKSAYEKDLRIVELERQLQDHSAQAFSIGETYANALSRIAELEAEIIKRKINPLAPFYDLEKDKEFREYFARLGEECMSKNLRKSILKEVMQSIHAYAADSARKAVAEFKSATTQAAEPNNLRNAILKLPLPNGQTEDGAFRDLSSWEREVFVRGALSMRKAAADYIASTALQAPVREVPGWQPIETAPKDGNRILGFTPFGVEPVKWKADEGEARGFMDGWIGVEQDSTCLPGYRPGRPNAQHQPTHWMPLPAAPVQEPKP